MQVYRRFSAVKRKNIGTMAGKLKTVQYRQCCVRKKFSQAVYPHIGQRFWVISGFQQELPRES